MYDHKKTIDVLSEKSKIWPILFDLLNKNIQNTDLVSAFKVSYNLHNLNKSEYSYFLFTVTDGLFSLSEAQRIIKIVEFWMAKWIYIFGISIWISPFGIEKTISYYNIFSKPRQNITRNISKCLSPTPINNSKRRNITIKNIIKNFYKNTFFNW